MRKNLAFLIGGFVLGLLAGIWLHHAYRQGVVVRAPAGAESAAAGAADAQATLAAEVLGLRQRLQEAPDDVAALTRLAHIHHDHQLWEPAALYYEQALAVAPPNADLLTDLGICYRKLGRFEEALESFATARSADGAHWQSLYNSAVVLAFDLGRYDEAREVLGPLLAMESPPPQLAELLEGIERASAGVTEEP